MLIWMPFPAATGFAMATLERVFLRVGLAITGDERNVVLAYSGGQSATGAGAGENRINLDQRASDRESVRRISEAVAALGIDIALTFDQQPNSPSTVALRKGGVRAIVSYWGAPISSEYTGLRLAIRRLHNRWLHGAPDHFVFESEAMRRLATHGRGIPAERTSVVRLGVDTVVFRPDPSDEAHIRLVFGLREGEPVIVYTGHMEPRKGVDVIVRAAVHLIDILGCRASFVLLGNRLGEAERFEALYRSTAAERYITFGGYRSDVPKLLRGATLGLIASTGWDSFTLSAIEMAASGLPILVSRLQGLAEAVDPGVTGDSFTPGDHIELAWKIRDLLSRPQELRRMGAAGRARAVRDFSTEQQISSLVSICSRALKARPAD
jgi:glycosyltransferase involved in cell wall biosynthesis